MSQVVSGVTQKLQDLLPNQIGENRRWTTAAVERYIMLADRAVRELTENLVGYQTISLVADTAAYTLDSEFIDVVAVEYASDGTTYDYYLRPATFSDFDRLNVGWRADGGTRPEYYTLLGAPGSPGAKIHVHRPMSSVTAQTIRVHGHRIGTSIMRAPDHVQMETHVPFVMAILVAKDDPRAAAMWYGRFVAGCERQARRSVSPYASGVVDVEVGY